MFFTTCVRARRPSIETARRGAPEHDVPFRRNTTEPTAVRGLIVIAVPFEERNASAEPCDALRSGSRAAPCEKFSASAFRTVACEAAVADEAAIKIPPVHARSVAPSMRAGKMLGASRPFVRDILSPYAF